MNIEIIEFYPISRDIEKDQLTGTIRIRLPELGIHILGIHAAKVKSRWHFTLPSRKAIDSKTDKEVRYPFFAFDNRDKQQELIAEIIEKGKAFIEKRIADAANLLVWPEKPKKQQELPAVKSNEPSPRKQTKSKIKFSGESYDSNASK